MIAAGFSFFVQSHWMGGFEPSWLEATILICVLASGEVGRQKGHLSDWAHFVTLGLLVISDSVLFGDDPYVPWAIFLYAVISSYMMMMIVGKYIKLKTPVQSTPPSTSVKLNWKYEPSHKKTLNTI